jgi:outer membrane immunogenic protein
MNRLLLASVAVVALAAPSFAADLPARPYTKAPAAAPVPYNWTGFYIGGFGGYSWAGKVRGDNTDFDDDGADEIAAAPTIKGGFGGGTLGYNWQMPGSQFVVGLEGELAGASIKFSFADPADGSSMSYKVNMFGSVTGRVGYAVNDLLIYAKGGYAWARTKLSVEDGADSFSASATHSGYTIGGGVEYRIAQNWSAKVEYLYADYGKATYGPAPDGDSGRAGLRNHAVKVGLNYHFN